LHIGSLESYNLIGADRDFQRKNLEQSALFFFELPSMLTLARKAGAEIGRKSPIRRVAMLKCSWVIVGLLAALFFPTQSHALTIDFSFSNTLGNTPGTVSGEIVDLPNDGFSDAGDAIVLSDPVGLATPLDTRVAGPGVTFLLTRATDFVLSNGTINIIIYDMEGFPVWQLCMDSGFGVCSSEQNGGGANNFLVNLADGELVATNASPTFTSATPLPAALPLFASGLGAMGLFGWRRKRKAQLFVA
jgi:hypothetical protein